NALFFEEQGLTDSTRVRLESIAVAENPALGDLALFRLAELDLKTGDSSAAVTTLERLAASFPDSYYVPFGMKIRADILVTRPDGAEAADALYRELLESYSDYPFTTEVRNKLRELQEARLVG
ncbi:MAG: tetratricopeptide repeat protein, partial [candidate division Zixibacteria bacterium]|nr:tetratricopeptide repeat protein [candidate division Zixibacteria bacterium]